MKVATAGRKFISPTSFEFITLSLSIENSKLSCKINISAAILNFPGRFEQQREACERKRVHSNTTRSSRMELPDGKFPIFFVNGKGPISPLNWNEFSFKMKLSICLRKGVGIGGLKLWNSSYDCIPISFPLFVV